VGGSALNEYIHNKSQQADYELKPILKSTAYLPELVKILINYKQLTTWTLPPVEGSNFICRASFFYE
jgi:hypothetical protein